VPEVERTDTTRGDATPHSWRPAGNARPGATRRPTVSVRRGTGDIFGPEFDRMPAAPRRRSGHVGLLAHHGLLIAAIGPGSRRAMSHSHHEKDAHAGQRVAGELADRSLGEILTVETLAFDWRAAISEQIGFRWSFLRTSRDADPAPAPPRHECPLARERARTTHSVQIPMRTSRRGGPMKEDHPRRGVASLRLDEGQEDTGLVSRL
jgi:hypothetical protein